MGVSLEARGQSEDGGTVHLSDNTARVKAVMEATERRGTEQCPGGRRERLRGEGEWTQASGARAAPFTKVEMGAKE